MNKFIIFIVIVFSVQLSADVPFPIVAYSCDRENNEIVFINTLDVESDPPGNYYQGDEELLNNYYPWDLVTITDDESGTRITDTTYIEEECHLEHGSYTVYIHPEVFNRNVLGRCGAAISGNVSVSMGNIVILKETALLEYCHSNKFIRKISLVETRPHSTGRVIFDISITTTEPFSY